MKTDYSEKVSTYTEKNNSCKFDFPSMVLYINKFGERNYYEYIIQRAELRDII